MDCKIKSFCHSLVADCYRSVFVCRSSYQVLRLEYSLLRQSTLSMMRYAGLNIVSVARPGFDLLGRRLAAPVSMLAGIFFVLSFCTLFNFELF